MAWGSNASLCRLIAAIVVLDLGLYLNYEYEPIGNWQYNVRANRIPFTDQDRVFITGAAGFIGMHTVLRLIRSQSEGGEGLNPNQIVGIDSLDEFHSIELKTMRRNQLSSVGIQVFRATLCESDLLEEIFRTYKFTHVIHLVTTSGTQRSRGSKHVQNDFECFDTLLETIRTLSPLSYLIYASSSNVYGSKAKQPFAESDVADPPVCVEGARKRSNELLAFTYFHTYGIQSTGLRFFTVYGEWGRPDTLVLNFLHSIATGIPIILHHNGTSQRDFIHIDDIIDGIVLASQSRSTPEPTTTAATTTTGLASSNNRASPQVFNLGSGRPVSMAHLIHLLEGQLGKHASVRHSDRPSGELQSTHADISKAWRVLGWQPKVPLEEGVRRLVTWYRSHGKTAYFAAGSLSHRSKPVELPAAKALPHYRLERFQDGDPDNPFESSLLPAFISEALAMRGPGETLARKSDGDGIVIAVLVATTSRALPSLSSVDGHPLCVHLLPSFFATLHPGFEYWLYVGYDSDDDLLDSPAELEKLHSLFQRQADTARKATGVVARLALLRHSPSEAVHVHKPGPVYNLLAAAAHRDGADYFYRVSDDMVFMTPWAREFTSLLAGLSPANLGVVGALCFNCGNPRVLAFDFTHRTHQAVHGTHAPAGLTDWWVDDWISAVYGRNNTVRHAAVRVRHMHLDVPNGRRYEVDWAAQRLLQPAINTSRWKVEAYLHRRMLSQCHATQERDLDAYRAMLGVATMAAGLASARENGTLFDTPLVSVYRPSGQDFEELAEDGVNGTRSLHNNSAVVEVVLQIAERSKYTPPWVTVMLVNNGILPMALNWICHIQNQGLTRVLETTLFVCLDRRTYRALRSAKYNSVFWRPGGSDWRGKQTYGTSNYFSLINFRQHLILDLLRHNVSILVAEPDATWYADLVALVEENRRYRKVDALAYDDAEPGKPTVPCGGLLFLRATPNTRNLIQQLNTRHKEALAQRGGKVSEQSVLQWVWKKEKGNFVILPAANFSSGQWYQRANPKRDGLVYIHANHMKGVDTKIYALKKHGQWFLGGVSRCYKTALAAHS